MPPISGQLRKAAILVASLDPRHADRLLEPMGSEQAARVRRAVMELGEVDAQEQRDVVEEFLRAQPAAGRSSPLDDSLAEILRQPHQPGQPLGATGSPGGRPLAPAGPRLRPFHFLHEASGEMICRCLQGEHPQMLALVVAHLQAERAADVVVHLPPPLQAEVLRRVADLDQAPAEIVQEVERQLETLFDQQFGQRAAGLSAVRAILAATDLDHRQQLLGSLQGHDPPLMLRLQSTFETSPPAPPRRGGASEPLPDELPGGEAVHPSDPAAAAAAEPAGRPDAVPDLTLPELASWDDDSLAAVFQAVDWQTLLLALAGGPPPLVGRVVAQLTPRDARAFERQMQQLGPLRLRDVERAQQRLLAAAARLVQLGQIPLDRPRRFAIAA